MANTAAANLKPPAAGFRVTREQGAWLAELSQQRFDQVIRPLIPAALQSKVGPKVYFNGRAVIEAIIAHRASVAGLMATGDGRAANIPARERLQAAQAGIAELKLQEMRGLLVNIAGLEAVWDEALEQLRGLGEQLQAQFGARALDMLNDRLERVAGRLLTAFAAARKPRIDVGTAI